MHVDRFASRRRIDPSGVALCFGIASLALSGVAAAQSPIERVSVDSNGVQGDQKSQYDYYAGSLSADGRFVAFSSFATNLVANDKNKVQDIFVRDRAAGATVRVSVSSRGFEGNAASYRPSISGDGRFVAFFSTAYNLVTSDTNATEDVFVHDRDPDGNGIFDEGNGETSRVNVDSNGHQANGRSEGASISADGRFVAFTSYAANLVSGDFNNRKDAFVHDRTTGVTTRVSSNPNGTEGDNDCYFVSISADGNSVAFVSYATNLVPGDTNATDDVFVADLGAGTLVRASVDSNGNEGDDHSWDGSLSSDGRFVVFTSEADNLVAGDNKYWADVFLHDVVTGATTMMSVDSAGGTASGFSRVPAISADGQFVVFESAASNLVANDTNQLEDVFLHDVATGETTILSRPCGIVGDGVSVSPTISGDGRFVEFHGLADDFVPGDTNGVADVFVVDRTIAALAEQANYGAGFPGTNGVPALTASAPPVLGTPLTIDVTNSLGTWSVAEMFVGTATASIPTRAGGTLLVGDLITLLPFVLLPATTSFRIDIPFDPALCGFRLCLQVIELDAGAAHGLSFTPGLELDFGG